MINRKLLIWSFLSYLMILIWLIYFKANIGEWINNTKTFFEGMSLLSKIRYGIIPFEHFKLWKVKSYLLNVLIFIPFFIYFEFIKSKRNNSLQLFLLLIIPIFIEVMQLFIPFCGFAVEDIICNMLGMYIGLIIAKYVNKINPAIINRLTIGSLIILLPLTIYGIINTIINFNLYQ